MPPARMRLRDEAHPLRATLATFGLVLAACGVAARRAPERPAAGAVDSAAALVVERPESAPTDAAPPPACELEHRRPSGDRRRGDGDGEPPPVAVSALRCKPHPFDRAEQRGRATTACPSLSTTQPYTNLMFDSGVMPATALRRERLQRLPEAHELRAAGRGRRLLQADRDDVRRASRTRRRSSRRSGTSRAQGTRPTTSSSASTGAAATATGASARAAATGGPATRYVKPFDDGMMEVADALALSKAAGKIVRRAGRHRSPRRARSLRLGRRPLTLPAAGHRRKVDHPRLRRRPRGVAARLRGRREGDHRADHPGAALRLPVLALERRPHDGDRVPAARRAHSLEGQGLVVGPTYVLPYSSDCLHFTGPGEQHLGEYFAKAYARVVLEGRRWEPLRRARSRGRAT